MRRKSSIFDVDPVHLVGIHRCTLHNLHRLEDVVHLERGTSLPRDQERKLEEVVDSLQEVEGVCSLREELEACNL